MLSSSQPISFCPGSSPVPAIHVVAPLCHPPLSRNEATKKRRLLHLAPTLEECYDVSPFGFCCKICHSKFGFDKYLYRIKNHANQDGCTFTTESVQRFHKRAQHRIRDVVARYGIDSFLVGETKGPRCSCGKTYQSQFSLPRHLREEPTHVASGVGPLYITKCGRFLSEMDLASFRDRYDPVPVPTDLPQNDFLRTQRFIRSIVPPNENPFHYNVHFHNWASSYPDENELQPALQSLVERVTTPVDETTEPLLCRLTKAIPEWIDNLPYCVDFVSSTLRHKLNNWTASSNNGSTSVHNEPFRCRHNPQSLENVLVKILRFVFRHDTHIFDHIKRTVKLSRDHSRLDFLITDLLILCIQEKTAVSHFDDPVIYRCLLACSCRVIIDKESANPDVPVAKLRTCGVLGKESAAFLAILKSAVCMKILMNCQHPAGEDACVREINENLVQQVTSSELFARLGSMIAKMRRMDELKPPIYQSSVDPNTFDITANNRVYPKSIWSKLIPMTEVGMKNILQRFFTGKDWLRFLDPHHNIVIERSSDHYKVTATDPNGNRHMMDALSVKRIDSAQHLLNQLASFGRLAFELFGHGAARESEIGRIPVSKTWVNGRRLHYHTEVIKSGNHQRGGLITKVHHQLPSTITVCFLLYRHVSHSFFGYHHEEVFPPKSPLCCAGNAAQALFNLGTTPSSWEVRKLGSHISNIVTGQKDSLLRLVANTETAEQFGHSARTHANHYSSNIEGGEDLHLSVWHRSLGYKEISAGNQSSPSSFDLHCALAAQFGLTAKFQEGQEEMVSIAAVTSPNEKHSIVCLPCGAGKSLAWELPPHASALSGRIAGTTIVVVPYYFLREAKLAATTKALLQVSDRVRVSSYDRTELSGIRLPNDLQHAAFLPNIIILSIDGLQALIDAHRETVRQWSEQQILQRIFLDEIHTLFVETFRDAYDVLPKLPQFKVPIMALSGTVPRPLLPVLCRYLHLSEGGDIHDSMHVVTSDQPVVGCFPSGFEVAIIRSPDCIDLALSVTRSQLNRVVEGPSSVHVICATKQEAASIHSSLRSLGFPTRLLHSGVSKHDQKQIATDWAAGRLKALISTTCGLVGNECPTCHSIVICGWIYSLMAVVQAIGRLRPRQRTQHGLIQICLPCDGPSHFLMEQDDLKLKGHLSLGLLQTGCEISAFESCCTVKGVLAWVGLKECRIASLSRAFSIPHNLVCRVCDICRGSPSARCATLSIGTEQVMKERARLANDILNMMVSSCCFSCMSRECDGETCLARTRLCYKCGSKDHMVSGCAVDYHRYKHQFCPFCLDNRNRSGYVPHSCQDCPLKKRVRCAFIGQFENQNESGLQRHQRFIRHIDRIFFSYDSFNQMIIRVHEDYIERNALCAINLSF